jgi:diguanylate cyclase (GGDEF)-like protein
MNRWVILVIGGLAVFASYAAVMFGLAGDQSFGPVTIAGIIFPGIVSGAVMIGWVMYETRNLREATGRADELSAQLVRKEIEIGRLATVDELTGLFTRREFDELLRMEFERRRRHGREISLLLVEIDDLSELGAHVGKLSKGYLLSEISAILSRELRTIDIGCRYTNDSLAMLLPETGQAQARIVAEKIRTAVAGRQFLEPIDGQGIKLTVSQGIATADSLMKTHTELAKAAEHALYQARTAGFDQIRNWDHRQLEGDAPPPPPPPPPPLEDQSIAS